MNGITRVLAKELGPQNIRVNSINPWRRRHRGRACIPQQTLLRTV